MRWGRTSYSATNGRAPTDPSPVWMPGEPLVQECLAWQSTAALLLGRSTGALLVQQPSAAGETLADVPPKLSSRVRLLDNDRIDKTDSHDARSNCIVALRHRSLRPVPLPALDAR